MTCVVTDIKLVTKADFRMQVVGSSKDFRIRRPSTEASRSSMLGHGVLVLHQRAIAVA